LIADSEDALFLAEYPLAIIRTGWKWVTEAQEEVNGEDMGGSRAGTAEFDGDC
jgi:hypothetical protein